MSENLATPEVRERVGIQDLKASVYKVPTDGPESDGTLDWDSTTVVLVELKAADTIGFGYTYASEATAIFIKKELQDLLIGRDVFQIPSIIADLKIIVRNQGMSGVAMMAISAIDIALWDLKAKILELPLFKLLGARTERMPLYGSGGFTNYSIDRLQQQLGNWAESGMSAVKMKVGRQAEKDLERVQAAREAIGEYPNLYVDANGAYNTKQALTMAEEFAKHQVTWFEEPVSSDNVESLRFLRNRAPAMVKIVAGEYGYIPQYYETLVQPPAVDVLQADASRCGGISGFIQIGMMCSSLDMLYSSHCVPLVHLHAAISLPEFFIAEYFYDHVRIENIFFESSAKVEEGHLVPDQYTPGIGIEFKHSDAEKYKI